MLAGLQFTRDAGDGGIVAIADVRQLPGVHRVYNLTVQGLHFYHVANAGVLVHNNYGEEPKEIVRRFTSRRDAKKARKDGIECDPAKGQGIPTASTSIEPVNPDKIKEMLGARHADEYIDIDITGKQTIRRRTKAGPDEIVVQETIEPKDMVGRGRVRQSNYDDGS